MTIEKLAVFVESPIGLPRVISDYAGSVATILKYLADVAVELAISELSLQDALIAITGKPPDSMRLRF